MTKSEDNEAHREKMRAIKAAQDAEVRSKEISRGIVLVHTGDGKGKSTAAFGLAIRSAGQGQRVGIVQFIKGTWKTGEKKSIEGFPEIDHVISGDGFIWNTQGREKDIASVRRGWDVAVDMIEQSRGDDPKYDLVVLDELNIALGMDYLPVEEVVEALKNKPTELSICVTGRGAKDELIEVADTVSKMRLVKHAYEAGIKARCGIEF
ncbi:MAG: cob(I)yrinic acid a,c-diamide adenosyltransferase [Myxococcota bacterium]